MKIRKAVIPVAGLARRLLPQSMGVPKCLMPVFGRDGRLYPLIHLQVKELWSAGIEKVALITAPWNYPDFHDHFSGEFPATLLDKAAHDPHLQTMLEEIEALGDIIEFLVQPVPLGAGHALFLAREFVDDEPFLFILGDHLFVSNQIESCFDQLMDKSGEFTMSTAGLFRNPLQRNSGRGYAAVQDKDSNGLWNIRTILYGPDQETARNQLAHPVLNRDEYLCVLGGGVLTPDIFEILDNYMDGRRSIKDEIGLGNPLKDLIQTSGMQGLEVNGASLEMDDSRGYASVIGCLLHTPVK